MKRLFDIIVSAISLLVLAPLYVFVALAIRLDSRGPVLFQQERIGRNFQPFTIFKFRSMKAVTVQNGPLITEENDTRITKVGSVLRAYKIDELPQLYNVLIGDMSFVGPRPEVQEYVNLYREQFKEILQVRPGITDPASIAFRNESKILAAAKNPQEEYRNTILPKKLQLSRQYCDSPTLYSDLRIIWKTLVAVVMREKN